MGGHEHDKELRHRSLDRKMTHITGIARHASHPVAGPLPTRKRFWKNFDPAEGEASFRELY
jgi:ribosomal protein S10